jgi:porin
MLASAGRGLALLVAASNVAQAVAQAPASSVRFVFTNFLQAGVDGDGKDEPLFGGKFDMFATIVGSDVGLWNGLSITVRPEAIYGRTVDESGFGNLLPVNTAMFHPAVGGDEFELSLNVTQRFANGAVLQLGKMNMLDAASRTPLVGGGGLEGFQHLQFAAPISFTTPAYVLGGLLSVPGEKYNLTFGLWDARDARDEDVFDEPFADGFKGFGTITLPVRPSGLQGWHGFTAGFSTQEDFDLRDFGEIIFPPAPGFTPSTRNGGWQLRYTFQQFLWQDAANPARGWGIFGAASVWDGNPTIGQWSAQFGVAGSPPLDSRPDDRFGAGAFYFAPSGDLKDSLAPFLDLGGEYGAEIFYTWGFGESFLVTANAQVVEPGPERSTAVFLGGRTNVKF